MFCASFTFSSGVDTWLEPGSRLRDAVPLAIAASIMEIV